MRLVIKSNVGFLNTFDISVYLGGFVAWKLYF